MIQRKQILLIVLVLTCINLHSQGGLLRIEEAGNILLKHVDPLRLFSSEPVDGSPYDLSDSFLVSTVFTHTHQYTNVSLRYNIYQDIMEYRQNGKMYALNPRVDIKKIITSMTTYLVQPYEEAGKIKLGFFNVVDSGNISLLKKKRIRLEPKADAKAYDNGPKNARFIPSDDLYFMKIGPTAARLFPGIKKFAAQWPEREKDILAFISKNKIKNNEEDLIKLFRYTDQLGISN